MDSNNTIGFRDWLRNNTNLLPSSINLYIRTINNYLNEYDDEIKIDFINEFVAESFRNKKSVYMKYAFKYYLEYIGKTDLYSKITKVKLKARKNPGKYIPDSLIKKIIFNIDDEIYRDIAMLQYATGARAVGIITLKAEKIDWEFSPDVIRLWMEEKGGKETVKFLDRSQYEEIMLKYSDKTAGFLFLPDHVRYGDEEDIERAARTTYSYYYSKLRKSAQELGLDRLGSHDLRRNFTERLKKEGAHIRTIQKALGHSNLTQTMKYFDDSPEDVEEAMLKHQH